MIRVILGTVAVIVVLFLGYHWLAGTPPPPAPQNPVAQSALPQVVVQTSAGTSAAPAAGAPAAPAAAGAPASGASVATGLGAAAAPGSRWLGTAQTVDNTTKGALPTGKAAAGNVPIKIAANTTVVIEGYEIGDKDGVNKKTGPLIVCANGPYDGTFFVHDGMVWDPVPTSQRGEVVNQIKANWALRTPALTATEVIC